MIKNTHTGEDMPIKLTLLLALLLLSSAILVRDVDASEEKVYILTLNYVKGDLFLDNVLVKIGYSPDRKIQPDTGYQAEVISFKGNASYFFKFKVPNVVASDSFPINGEPTGGLTYLDKVDFALIIPYFGDGKTINLYDENGTKKLSVDISRFSEGECLENLECDDNNACTTDICSGTIQKCSNIPVVPCCGNGKCEAGESYAMCPVDCTATPAASKSMWPLFAGVLTAVILVLVYLKRKTQT